MAQGDNVSVVLDQWRREAPGVDVSPMGVIGRISRLSQLIGAELEPVFELYDLNGGEFDVLATLRRAGKPYRLTPTQLSKALMVSSGGMTKRLGTLADRGLISRRTDPDDRRSSTVSLTRKGRGLVETVLEEHVANEHQLLEGLTAHQRQQLATLLERLAISLGDTPQPGRSGGARGRGAVSRPR